MANTNLPTYFLRAGLVKGADSEADFEFNGKPARLFVASDGHARVHHVLKTGVSKDPVAEGTIAASNLEGEKMPRAYLTLRTKAKNAKPYRYAMWKHVRDEDRFWTIQPSPSREGDLFDL